MLPLSQSQKTERHVFLLDGLAICCKQIRGRVGEYRLKEKINTRKVKLIDMEEADGEGGCVNEGGIKLLGRGAKAFSSCSSWIRLPGCHEIYSSPCLSTTPV